MESATLINPIKKKLVHFLTFYSLENKFLINLMPWFLFRLHLHCKLGLVLLKTWLSDMQIPAKFTKLISHSNSSKVSSQMLHFWHWTLCFKVLTQFVLSVQFKYAQLILHQHDELTAYQVFWLLYTTCLKLAKQGILNLNLTISVFNRRTANTDWQIVVKEKKIILPVKWSQISG